MARLMRAITFGEDFVFGYCGARGSDGDGGANVDDGDADVDDDGDGNVGDGDCVDDENDDGADADPVDGWWR